MAIIKKTLTFKEKTQQALGLFAQAKKQLEVVNEEITARRTNIALEQDKLKAEDNEILAVWSENEKAMQELNKFIPSEDK